MKTSRIWSLTALGFAALVGLASAALAQQPGRTAEERPQRTEEAQQSAPATANPDAATEKSRRRVLAVIQLQHCKAQDIQQLLNFDAQYAAQARAARPTPEADQAGSSNQSVPQQEDVRVATTEESDVLFLRGPEEAIKRIQQLIETLDVPPEELKRQKLGHMHVIPVRGENSSQIQSVLSQLGLDSQIVQQAGEMHLIIVPLSEGEAEDAAENAQQVEEIVSRLDQEKSRSEAVKDASEDDSNDQTEEDASETNGTEDPPRRGRP